MAFHCGAPTRDGSACQRHVRDPGTRCSQHRHLGGPALRPPRLAMRVIELADPALTAGQTVWPSSPRDRVTPPPGQESQPAETGTLPDEEPMFYDAEDTDDDAVPTTPVWLQWAAEGRERAVSDGQRDERDEPSRPAGGGGAKQEPETERPHPRANGHAAKAEQDPEPRVEQRPQLRRERALDPDWIAARPLFRDETPTRPKPKIEFEPSDAALPRRTPRIAPMRSVVLNPLAAPAPDPDPPTLIDRMPPIDPDDLAVPEFLRPDFVPSAPGQKPQPAPPATKRTPITDFLTTGRSKQKPQPAPPAEPPAAPDRPPLPIRQRRPRPTSAPTPARTATPTPTPTPRPTPKPAAPAATTTAAPKPLPTLPTTRKAVPAPPKPAPLPDPDPPTLVDLEPVLPLDDISVPDFVAPGFIRSAAEPPLRTVLSTVLGPDLWQRCSAAWGPAHCTALARIARAVDGLAPSASAAMRSTAGAGMRWLGVAREREMLADLVAGAISHPAGATAANQARTVRLYGAAICVALNVPLRRCACHSDLERDVSGELIRLGLAELAGEVP